jgi:diaminopropionate ammonia-lyase
MPGASSATGNGLTHFHNSKANPGNAYTDAMREIVSLSRSNEAMDTIRQWPGYAQTPLHQLEGLARRCNVGDVFYKDESGRFGLKSFKALGGSYAVAKQLLRIIETESGKSAGPGDLFGRSYSELLQKVTVVTATDGNHGRAVAWGASLFGCNCVIFIHADVSEGREQAMAELGADVRRINGNYDDSVKEAAKAAEANDWIVVSDNSYDGYVDIPKDVAAGYTVMLQETVQLLDGIIPTHIFVQGGCGGLASAVCGYFWELYEEKRPRLVVVEPEQANCLQLSAEQGTLVTVDGKLETLMAGLACGEVSLLAWDILETGADDFMTLPEHLVPTAMKLLAAGTDGDPAIEAGESAVAGVGALMALADDPEVREKLGLSENSSVLVLGTEGATDPELYQRLIA